jgi:hypothetical protein
MAVRLPRHRQNACGTRRGDRSGRAPLPRNVVTYHTVRRERGPADGSPDTPKRSTREGARSLLVRTVRRGMGVAATAGDVTCVPAELRLGLQEDPWLIMLKVLPTSTRSSRVSQARASRMQCCQKPVVRDARPEFACVRVMVFSVLPAALKPLSCFCRCPGPPRPSCRSGGLGEALAGRRHHPALAARARRQPFGEAARPRPRACPSSGGFDREKRKPVPLSLAMCPRPALRHQARQLVEDPARPLYLLVGRSSHSGDRDWFSDSP